MSAKNRTEIRAFIPISVDIIIIITITVVVVFDGRKLATSPVHNLNIFMQRRI